MKTSLTSGLAAAALVSVLAAGPAMASEAADAAATDAHAAEALAGVTIGGDPVKGQERPTRSARPVMVSMATVFLGSLPGPRWPDSTRATSTSN